VANIVLFLESIQNFCTS